MNLEERLQVLLIEREQTLTDLKVAVQRIQYLLALCAQQIEQERQSTRIKRYF